MCVGLCMQFLHHPPTTVKPIWPSPHSREGQRSQKHSLPRHLKNAHSLQASGEDGDEQTGLLCWPFLSGNATVGELLLTCRRGSRKELCWWIQIWPVACCSATACVLLSRMFNAFPWALRLLGSSSVSSSVLTAEPCSNSVPACWKPTSPQQRPHWRRPGSFLGAPSRSLWALLPMVWMDPVSLVHFEPRGTGVLSPISTRQKPRV